MMNFKNLMTLLLNKSRRNIHQTILSPMYMGQRAKTIYTLHKRIGSSKYSPNNASEKAKNRAALKSMGLSTNVYDSCWDNHSN